MKQNKKIQIVIMGDSNTEGYGLSCIEQTYPYKLNKLVGNNVSVHNMGISGSCVINTAINGHMVGMPYVQQEKYKNALNIDGDFYIINLGTNDAQDGMDDNLPIIDKYSNLIKYQHRFYGDYKRIIDDIIKIHPDAKIAVCTPVPVRKCIWRKHRQKYLEMLLPYFKDIFKEYSQIQCIDLQSAFLKLNDEKIDKMYLDDGLHLNDNGTNFVANYMEPSVRELIIEIQRK